MWTTTFDLLDREVAFTAHYIPRDPNTGLAYATGIAYDRFGNVSERTITRAGVTTDTTLYSYDKRNRLVGATFNGANSVTVTPNDADERTAIGYPNGVSQTFTRNADETLDVITLNRAPSTLERWDYDYDANRNITVATTLHGNYGYGYDGLDRLTSASYPASLGWTADAFAYDKVGNREDPANPARYEYDANNRMIAGLATYSYDQDGSQTSVDSTGCQGYTFSQLSMDYDVSNRPRTGSYLPCSPGPANAAEQPDPHKALPAPGAGVLLSYTHDPLGRRLTAAHNAQGLTARTTRYYLWSGTAIVADILIPDQRWTPKATRFAFLPGDFAPTRATDTNGSYWVHADHLSTPRRATNATGALVWRADFKAFGEAKINADVDGDGKLVEIRQRFPGQYLDDTGYYYNHLRDYEPNAGRYNQADPIGLLGGVNSYAYGKGNPLRFTDPRGKSYSTDCVYLQALVIVFCKGSTSCNSEDSCPVLVEKIRIKERCILSQILLTQACFPESPSHHQRIRDEVNGIKRCIRILEGLSEILCARHTMTMPRSMYATQEDCTHRWAEDRAA